jgi:hypothetical protein
MRAFLRDLDPGFDCAGWQCQPVLLRTDWANNMKVERICFMFLPCPFSNDR